MSIQGTRHEMAEGLRQVVNGYGDLKKARDGIEAKRREASGADSALDGLALTLHRMCNHVEQAIEYSLSSEALWAALFEEREIGTREVMARIDELLASAVKVTA
jgi:hypothetical protein